MDTLMEEYDKVDSANKKYITKKISLEKVLNENVNFKTVLRKIHETMNDDDDSIEFKVLDSLVSMNFNIDSAINQFIHKHIQRNDEGVYNDIKNLV